MNIDKLIQKRAKEGNTVKYSELGELYFDTLFEKYLKKHKEDIKEMLEE